MTHHGHTERDDREAADIAPSRPSSSAEQQILNLARLLARIAARDAAPAPDPIREEE